MAKEFAKEDLKKFAAENRREYEGSLERIVEIPTVSVEPERKQDLRRGAEYAVSLLESKGAKARLYETKGHPIVYGRFDRGPNLPTLTVYNHLDVQPAEGPDWKTPPFDFVKKGDRYYGRGTTDDKGPAMTALFGALYAWEQDVPLNIRFLWELEEEIGSPHFESTIKENAKEFATDSVVVSDTVWISRSRPAQPAGLRGLQGFRFTLQTGETDQHSGTAGGAARNPVTELCQLICDCVDGKTGRVKIPGFYADVVPPSKRDLEDLKNSGFTTRDFKRDHLFRSIRVEDPLEIMKRVWMMPTFEVHGIAGGYQGPGVKTIIPPKATAIVSCRLVPNMDPKKIVRLVTNFVKQKNPDVKVEPEHALPAYQGKTTGPYADAIRAAMKFAFGKEPVFVREGGSIGAVLSMEKVLKSPVFFLGLSLPEHGYHAPNENFDWGQAEGGMAAFADYFRRVAELGKTPKEKLPTSR
ncbi:MAG TPA: M20/M25/M40 family metallo-hydrolase [Thermoanaerobaculia bacterium]|jgi:acetylornithine deacetylase/succinyl-diaminopimelate desuccinylase-like protein|nr:M20/M25/M40 family metallo-hydrolase [Thermoanaerobaculia bacterium]